MNSRHSDLTDGFFTVECFSTFLLKITETGLGPRERYRDDTHTHCIVVHGLKKGTNTVKDNTS